MWRGWAGSRSSLRRNMATCVSTVRLITSSLGPQLRRPAGSPHLMAREIHRDVAEAVQRRVRGALAPDPLEKIGRALDRPDDALVVERLQEIIERLDLERVHGVLFERGDEHDRRRPLFVHRRRDRETIEVGHLNVQEHEIRWRRHAPEQLHGVAAARALVDVRDAADLLQHAAQPAPRRRFIVNDDRAHDRSRECRSRPGRRGRPAGGRWSARSDDWDRTAPADGPVCWRVPILHRWSCR